MGVFIIKKKMKVLISLIVCLVWGFSQFNAVSAKEEPYEKLDVYLKNQMKVQGIAGLSYVIIENDKIVHEESFGKADLNKKLTTKTPMRLASLSKSFTALSILQLVEQGDIQLDTPVKQYIPWFELKNSSLSSEITIRHLLQQTSGISSDGELVLGINLLNKSLEETVKLLKDVDMSHPAGTEFEYTNLNYLCLGLVVEYVSGMSLSSYIQSHILNPLDMTNSYTSIEEANQHGLSKGFTSWFGLHMPTDTLLSDLPNFLASGYMVSSSEDMGKYLQMYMNMGQYNESTILSKQGVETLQTPSKESAMYRDDTLFGHYAMGWWERNIQGTKVIGHSGDLPSLARTDMYIIPDKKIGIVLLTNTHNGLFAPGDSHISTDGIISLLLGKVPATETDSNYFTHYLLFDGILLLILLLIIGLAILQIKKRNKLSQKRFSLSLVLTIIQIGAPILLFFLTPILLGIPSWGYLYSVQADLVSAIFIILFLFMAIGMVKLSWWIKTRKKGTVKLLME